MQAHAVLSYKAAVSGPGGQGLMVTLQTWQGTTQRPGAHLGNCAEWYMCMYTYCNIATTWLQQGYNRVVVLL
jgi:hypothetical protein